VYARRTANINAADLCAASIRKSGTERLPLNCLFLIGLNIPGCTMKIINAIAEDRLLCWAVATALVILMFELVL
jgi:hypothetical protein